MLKAKTLVKYDQVQVTMCSQLTFSGNQWMNGAQLKMGVTLLACGVSEQIHTLLHSVGLTCSCRTALREIAHLTKVNKENTRNILKQNHILRPFLCVDNIDFGSKVHNRQIEKAKKPLHGTWGYFRVILKDLLGKDDCHALSLQSFSQSMCVSRGAVRNFSRKVSFQTLKEKRFGPGG